jgi:hypothetical protein
MRAARVAVLCVGSFACAAPADLGPVDCVIGTGVTQFVPLEEGAVVRIAAGPQGGHHIWGAVAARGLETRQARVRYTHSDALTGEALGEVEETLDLTPLTEDLLSGPLNPDCPASGRPEGGPGNAGAGGVDAGFPPSDLTGWSMALASTVFVTDDGSGTFPRFVGQTVRTSVELRDAAGRSCRASRLVRPCF